MSARLVTVVLACGLLACNTPPSRDPGALRDVTPEAHLSEIARLHDLGHYAQALESARALRSSLARGGFDDRHAASALTLEGSLYVAQQDPGAALPILARARQLHEAQGAPPERMATVLGLLARARLQAGDLDAALEAATRALGLRRQTDERFAMSTSLLTLGDVLLAQDRLDDAQTAYEEAIQLRREDGGGYALSLALERLGELLLRRGELPAARRATELSIDLMGDDIAADHVRWARVLSLLGRIDVAQGQYGAAFAALRRSLDVETTAIRHLVGFSSERQQISYLEASAGRTDRFLDLVSQHLAEQPDAVSAAHDAVLARKGVVLDVQKRFHEVLLDGDAAALQVFESLSRVRSQLSHLTLADADRSGSRAHLATLETLRDEAQTLERQLGKRSGRYLDYARLLDSSSRAVRDALAPDEMLIEFVRPRGPGASTRGDRYLAFVADGTGRFELVNLGDAARIDDLVMAMRTGLQRAHGRRDHLRTMAIARRTHAAVLAPVLKAVSPTTRIIVSPADALSLLPFEALVGPDQRFLIQDHVVSYVTSGRELLKSRSGGTWRSPPLLLGDPDFGTPSPEPPSAGTHGLGRDGFPVHFEPLPGTADEVQQIAALLEVSPDRVLSGAGARDDALRAADRPRYLHLATHGFYLPTSDGAGGADALVRSGLALSGANAAAGTSARTEGILTAREALALRLTGTELVTLSSCESGLGDLRAGEGVFGLRRAFSQAGARRLVVSLWPVDDRLTADLMADFYRRLATEGAPAVEALRTAALAQMDRVTARFGAPHPLYWAGFILSGDPR